MRQLNEIGHFIHHWDSLGRPNRNKHFPLVKILFQTVRYLQPGSICICVDNIISVVGVLATKVES